MAAQGYRGLMGSQHLPAVPATGLNISGQDHQLVRNRSLNSWMAYRSYYVRLFKGIQQKYASTLLHGLWYEDPFKAKWAVIAKTYTVIKDKVGKEYVPLAKFLNIACPIMGIIEVQDYFHMLKWAPVYTDGILHVVRVGQPDMATFDPAILGSSLTDIDLMVKVCNTELFKAILRAQDVRNCNQYILASAPTGDRDNINRGFLASIQADPRAMAAQIFGMHPNHSFLEISASNRPRDNVQPYNPPFLAGAAQQTSVQPPEQMMGPQHWSGNLSNLYSADDLELDLEALDENVITDLSNPIDLDTVFPVAGDEFDEDDDDVENEYNFTESF